MKTASPVRALCASLMLGLTTLAAPAQGEGSIILADASLFPESLAVDASGDFYVSSVMNGQIVHVTAATGATAPFTDRGEHGLISVGGLMLIDDGATLLACNSDLGINAFKGASAPALLAFDTAEGRLTGRWELPGGGMCNDIATGPDGKVYVTDSFVPRILVLDPERTALAPLVTDGRFAGEGFNLSGIAMLGNSLIVGKFNSGQLFRIDLDAEGKASTPVELTLSEPLRAPDGIRTLDGANILIAESGGRLSKVTIEGNRAQVTPLAEGLRAPTAVALQGGLAYVLEGQLDRLPFLAPGTPGPENFAIVPIRID